MEEETGILTVVKDEGKSLSPSLDMTAAVRVVSKLLALGGVYTIHKNQLQAGSRAQAASELASVVILGTAISKHRDFGALKQRELATCSLVRVQTLIVRYCRSKDVTMHA